jgi:hypothetical protein
MGLPLFHPQEALHKEQLVCCLRIMSGGCYQFQFNPGSSQQTQHARSITVIVCVAPPEDEQVVLETYRVR